jgi:murein DD-endopeptidase MepM/ murein hydrolase activator NlpD
MLGVRMSIKLKTKLSSLKLKTTEGLQLLKKHQKTAVIAIVVVGVIAFTAIPRLSQQTELSPIGLTSITATESVFDVSKSFAKEIPIVEDDAFFDINLRWSSQFLCSDALDLFTISSKNLQLDGQTILSLESAQDVQRVMDQLMKVELDENQTLVGIGFKENVKFVSENVSPWEFNGYLSVEEAMDYIQTGGVLSKTYTVKENDTISGIAEYHGISETDLIAANPILKEKKYLQIGDKLNLTVQQPLVTVEKTLLEEYVLETQPQIITEKSNTLYVGEQRVKVAGTPGEREILAEIKYENSKEITREIKNEKVLVEAKPSILYTGTKIAPATVASGNLQRPASGYVVYSRFGGRSLGYHTGIDLSMPSGSTVKAADGGTVVFSGNQGTYGLLVKIDHGDGTTTLYAHNSKLLVKKGDKVFKGQKIALSGNTGRSTGPHLHFEVRINDVPVNPEKYLNF